MVGRGGGRGELGGGGGGGGGRRGCGAYNQFASFLTVDWIILTIL